MSVYVYVCVGREKEVKRIFQVRAQIARIEHRSLHTSAHYCCVCLRILCMCRSTNIRKVLCCVNLV